MTTSILSRYQKLIKINFSVHWIAITMDTSTSKSSTKLFSSSTLPIALAGKATWNITQIGTRWRWLLWKFYDNSLKCSGQIPRNSTSKPLFYSTESRYSCQVHLRDVEILVVKAGGVEACLGRHFVLQVRRPIRIWALEISLGYHPPEFSLPRAASNHLSLEF